MFLRDIAVHADERIVDRFPGGFVKRFHRETCGVTAVFISQLKRKLIAPNSPKLSFVFSDLVSEPPTMLAPLRLIWPFNFSRYVTLNDREKAQQIADALADAMDWIGKSVGWPDNVVRDIWNEGKSRSFAFYGTSRKSWTSPDQRFKATIDFHMDVGGVELSAVISKNRSNQIVCEKHLDKLPAYDGCLLNYIGEGTWVSDSEFRLRASSFPPKEWLVSVVEEVE